MDALHAGFVVSGVVALAAALGLLAVVGNPFVRGRLRFSAWLLAAFLLLALIGSQPVADAALIGGLARLVFVLAVINLVVALAVNPWRGSRPSESFPAIVQDVLTIATFVLVSTVLMKEQLLTTSAVGAVVVGFALQDTLGNLFAGLAIQVEKPFRVGQWIAVGDREGQVQEVTWRATKLRTKAGQFLIVPNSVMGKEAILNYSEPIVPTRLEIEVGASYTLAPHVVKQALREALDNSPMVLDTPAPAIVLRDFGDSAIVYRVMFWVEDYGTDMAARDQVRTNIWYSFRRHNVEIPWPIRVNYQREDQPARTIGDVAAAADVLGNIELFATLTPEVRLALAEAAREQIFAAGEAVVRRGAAGDSMFVILKGGVRVLLEPSQHEVAAIDEGGFFGEMSMLTGEPRSATVRAARASVLLEVGAERFRRLAVENPGLLEHISAVVERRREGLETARADAARAPADSPHADGTLLGRIREFLRL
ncbi:MAG: cyclic nucleotide-binding domain-containing protein [Vicinamibacterales bacterium]